MKKQQLYLSSIADDAPQTAKDYGLGLELAQFCTAAFLDNPDKVTELFPQDCARAMPPRPMPCKTRWCVHAGPSLAGRSGLRRPRRNRHAPR